MDAAVGEVSLVVRTIAEVLWTGMWSGNNASLGLVRGALTKGMDVPFLADDLYTAANRIARKAAQEMDLSNVPMSIEGLDES